MFSIESLRAENKSFPIKNPDTEEAVDYMLQTCFEMRLYQHTPLMDDSSLLFISLYVFPDIYLVDGKEEISWEIEINQTKRDFVATHHPIKPLFIPKNEVLRLKDGSKQINWITFITEEKEVKFNINLFTDQRIKKEEKTTMKTISAKELYENGWIHEANRLFFHPRGAAMFVVKEGDGSFGSVGVEDHSVESVGISFATINMEKVKRMEERLEMFKEARQLELGFIIQPAEEKKD